MAEVGQGMALDPLLLQQLMLARRRKLMQELYGAQPEDNQAVVMAGGMAAPNWGGAISKVANALGRVYGEGQLSRAEAALQQQEMARQADEVARISGALKGDPGIAVPDRPASTTEQSLGGPVELTAVADANGTPPLMDRGGPLGAVPPDYNRAIAMAIQSQSPQAQAMGKWAEKRMEDIAKVSGLSPDAVAQFYRTGNPADVRGERYRPDPSNPRVIIDRNLDTGKGSSPITVPVPPDVPIATKREEGWDEDVRKDIKATYDDVRRLQTTLPEYRDLYANIDKVFSGMPLGISELQLGLAKLAKGAGATEDAQGRIAITESVRLRLAKNVLQDLKNTRPSSNQDINFVSDANAEGLAKDPRLLGRALEIINADYYNKAMRLGQLTHQQAQQKGGQAASLYQVDARFPAAGLGSVGVEYDQGMGVFTPAGSLSRAQPGPLAAPQQAPSAPPQVGAAPQVAPPPPGAVEPGSLTVQYRGKTYTFKDPAKAAEFRRIYGL